MKKINLVSMKTVNIMLIVIHIVLCIMFIILDVRILVIVNIASVLIYTLLYKLCITKVRLFTYISVAEVVANVTFTTLVLGWSTGFYMYFFCMVACLFLSDYINRSEEKTSFYPLLFSIILVVLFATLRWVTMRFDLNRVEYLTDTQVYALYILNIAVTFTFLIYYLNMMKNRIIAKERQLKEMAHKDELTGLPNRYLMCDWLREAYSNSENLDEQMSIAMLDIDDFKMINDLYGHRYGDYVLREFARRIENHTGNRIKCCRWGGEEIVLLCTGEGSYEHMIEKVEELSKCVNENSYVLFEDNQKVTFTAGIAKSRATDKSYHEVLARADELLYKGKESGKNRIEKEVV